MPAFCRNRHFVLSGYILCHSEMLYPLQLFHLQRSRMQIIALLRVVRDQQHKIVQATASAGRRAGSCSATTAAASSSTPAAPKAIQCVPKRS